MTAERDDRVERRLRLVELRRMAAIVEDEAPDGGRRALFDRANLRERAVLVFGALDHERRNAPASTDGSMFQALNFGSSQAPFQPQKATSTLE